MSLDKLFSDRKTRKYIKEQVYNGTDIGQGVCSFCGSEGYLIKALDKCLCESCCDKVLEQADNYDNVFEGIPELDVEGLLCEGYLIPDFQKVQDVANQKFGGSVQALAKSYGFNIKYKPNDTFLQDGKIFVYPDEIKPTSRLNQFMIDFDGKVLSTKGRSKLKPDADGTEAPMVVATQADIDKNKQIVASNPNWGGFTIGYEKGKRGRPVGWRKDKSKSQADPNQTQAQTAQGTQSTSTQAPNPVGNSTASVPNVNAKPVIQAQNPTPTVSADTGTAEKVSKLNDYKFDTSGTEDDFTLKLSGLEINAKLSAENGDVKTYDVSVKGGDSKQYVIDTKGSSNVFKTVVDYIVSQAEENPQDLFPGFEGEGKTIGINKYDIYQFTIDEYTFREKVLSLALVFNGKLYQKSGSRAKVSAKAFLSKATMLGELTKHMDEIISNTYPIFFNGNNVVKTSVGKLVYTFKGFDKDRHVLAECPMNGVKFGAVFNNDDPALKDVKNAKDTFLKNMFNLMNIVIPDWDDNVLSKNLDYKYTLPTQTKDGRKFDVYADFDIDGFLESGDLIFKFSVIDQLTGEENPKSAEKVIYRKAGTPLKEFLNKEGQRIFKYYFNDSNMTDMMTLSARKKMESGSKKQALFNKISDKFIKVYSLRVKELNDCEVNVSIDVNANGKITSGTIKVIDFYGDLADNARDLQSRLSLDKVVKYLKFVSAKDTREGAEVTYSVTDIEDFSKDLELYIMENLIFEAFGIVRVNESGRKMFYF